MTTTACIHCVAPGPRRLATYCQFFASLLDDRERLHARLRGESSDSVSASGELVRSAHAELCDVEEQIAIAIAGLVLTR